MGHEQKGGASKALAPYLDRDRSTCLSCPKCGSATRVIDSREGPENSVRRRRGCCNSTCLHRMTTYELVIDNAPFVDLVKLAGKVRGTLDGARVLLDQAADQLQAAATLAELDK